jgi:hypothetical protein
LQANEALVVIVQALRESTNVAQRVDVGLQILLHP